MNSRSSGARSEGFFTGKGFYIVLFLCAAVIGVSAWMLAAGNETMAEEQNGFIMDSRRVETVIVPALDDPAQPAMAMDNPIKLEPPEINTDGIAVAEPVQEELAPASASVYLWPVMGEIERGHSTDKLYYDTTLRDWRTHEGVDICAPLGTSVLAAHCGTVESIASDDFYGTVVTVSHGDGMCTEYANLAPAPAVSVGQWVEPGDVIGSVGTTALCEIGQGTHLHFAVTVDGCSADPLAYLPG